ncbi:hypothetical protein BpHYR1_029420 [Brachionus plicatilis]|uniref:Secreted protein n=1 Tax=Brachionus plicatilis TaxID=10195 RepID=A0A3M7PR27_BRAPC|nr:hypothetical protein BpHYR1_029420 [Brachionus plicatilis]
MKQKLKLLNIIFYSLLCVQIHILELEGPNDEITDLTCGFYVNIRKFTNNNRNKKLEIGQTIKKLIIYKKIFYEDDLGLSTLELFIILLLFEDWHDLYPDDWDDDEEAHDGIELDEADSILSSSLTCTSASLELVEMEEHDEDDLDDTEF